MKVTPLDLRQQRFRTVFRGFDRVEVTSFLAELADDYEQAFRESERLRQDLARMEALLNEHREQEKSLRNTLLTAQRLADEIRQNAEAEAQRVVREAEGRADLLLQKTQARLEDVQRETDGMKLKRKEAETSIESTISALRNTLDYVREQDERERQEKVLLHRPRHLEAPQTPVRHELPAGDGEARPGPTQAQS
ncbi:MAG TPA: DivIVA domain-containing protein [Vicinamibacterales bacterium]|nr:DivIVA domain-containing protein [Vicinamibacterales bacterium]